MFILFYVRQIAKIVTGCAFLLLFAHPNFLFAQPLQQGKPNFVVGIGVHLIHGKRSFSNSLERIRAAGILSIRDDAPWAYVERLKNQRQIMPAWDDYMSLARRNGISPLLIFDYGNPNYDGGLKPRSNEAVDGFAKYAETVAKHYLNSVDLYEIWNEWDHPLAVDRASAQEYVRLVSSVSPRVRLANPKATILGGAATALGVRKNNKFIEDIVDFGILRYVDAISLHTYNWGEKENRPEDWHKWMQQLYSRIEMHAGRAVPIYVTEMGWPTHKRSIGLSEERQAEYLVRLYFLARTLPFIVGVWWYDFQDDGIDPMEAEHNFGIVKTDFTPKLAYSALQAISPLLSNGLYVGRDDLGMADLFLLRFAQSKTKDSFVLWSANDKRYVVRLIANGEPPDLKVILPGKSSVRPSWTAKGANKFETELTAGSMPAIIDGDLASITVLVRKN